MDHRYRARAVFHAGGDPRRRGLVVPAGRRGGVRRRGRLRSAGWCCRGSPASTGPRQFSRRSRGASEMAVLGERFGARVDRVAAAQSLRILIVVIVIPFAYAWLACAGPTAMPVRRATFEPGGLRAAASGDVCGRVGRAAVGHCQRVHPGLAGGRDPLTAVGVSLSSMPTPLSNVAQCLLGCALGSRFEPGLRARRAAVHRRRHGDRAGGDRDDRRGGLAARRDVRIECATHLRWDLRRAGLRRCASRRSCCSWACPL